MKLRKVGRRSLIRFDAVAEEIGAAVGPVRIVAIPRKVAGRWREANAVYSAVRIIERIVLPRHADVTHDILFLSLFCTDQLSSLVVDVEGALSNILVAPKGQRHLVMVLFGSRQGRHRSLVGNSVLATVPHLGGAVGSRHVGSMGTVCLL